MLLKAVTLHWLKEAGLKHFGVSGEAGSWHLTHGLGNLLLFDPAKVEAVHAIARCYATRGWSLAGVQFFERQPMIASVEYTHPDEPKRAHLTVVWASMLDTQRMLCDRLAAIPQAMDAHSGDSAPFRPDGLALVGDGEWGAARALYMACATLAAWVSPDRIAGWFHGDGGGWNVSDADSVIWGSPLQELPRLSGLMEAPLEPAMSVRQLGRRSLAGVLAPYLHIGASLAGIAAAADAGGPVSGREQYLHYQDLVGESTEGAATKARMKLLEKLKLGQGGHRCISRATAPKRSPKGVPVTLTQRGQGGHRYITTKRGRVFICYAHGGKPNDLAARTKLGCLWATRKSDGAIIDIWRYRHEDIIFEFLGQLVPERCPFGPGWQARTTSANGQRIDPDAIILVESLFGPVVALPRGRTLRRQLRGHPTQVRQIRLHGQERQLPGAGRLPHRHGGAQLAPGWAGVRPAAASAHDYPGPAEAGQGVRPKRVVLLRPGRDHLPGISGQ